MEKKVAIIIPARLASKRLPNKPMAQILGKTMIQRVYEKASSANVGEVFIACDSDEVVEHAKTFGARAIMTDSALQSGTDRVYSCLQKIAQDFDLVVNLQGDLPNIDPNAIKSAVDGALKNGADITTIASIIKNPEEIDDVNVVKIAIAFNKEKYGEKCGRALYFSRLAIPYSKDKSAKYYHHIGIYVFTPQSLARFTNLVPTDMGKRESLEQLRALENDMKIMVNIVESHPLSVDTAQDLENVTLQIKNQEN